MLEYVKQFIRNWRDYPLQPGDVVRGRYEIAEWLGMGSYGLSYRCIDRTDGSEVALKQAKPSRRRLAAALLLRERDALLAMDHPFIPRCREFFADRRSQWLAADYVRGRTLEDLIFEEGQVYEEADCLGWMLELLDRIAYVHARGYVHLDIRIPNVMMGESGLYLIDFGLARRIGEEEGLAPDGSPLPARMPARVTSDLEDAGHLLLYMLYSGYSPPGKGSESGSAEKPFAWYRAKGKRDESGRVGESGRADESMSGSLPEAGMSWQQELKLSERTTVLLRRLLQLDHPYLNAEEASAAVRVCLEHLQSS
ncbi:serine/threonine protein kinase [Saccharibacillus kuerlensis]|uniref:Serine/threonine protein kinase n=1 Tax=Saccharibacillus kuerlensis TaxID=459527 RepID=A0ABQ2L4I1_9BACL|nr:protein kinase family protein [Saccharibacillus kuerlensis]GGO00299.1 serine/threonine protein kinase [Saccharibacillus kuerlensis]